MKENYPSPDHIVSIARSSPDCGELVRAWEDPTASVREGFAGHLERRRTYARRTRTRPG